MQEEKEVETEIKEVGADTHLQIWLLVLIVMNIKTD